MSLPLSHRTCPMANLSSLALLNLTEHVFHVRHLPLGHQTSQITCFRTCSFLQLAPSTALLPIAFIYPSPLACSPPLPLSPSTSKVSHQSRQGSLRADRQRSHQAPQERPQRQGVLHPTHLRRNPSDALPENNLHLHPCRHRVHPFRHRQVARFLFLQPFPARQ
jgi:hypothetical protein